MIAKSIIEKTALNSRFLLFFLTKSKKAILYEI